MNWWNVWQWIADCFVEERVGLRSKTNRKSRKSLRPSPLPLEGRSLLSVTTVMVSASPQILFPPNGRIEYVSFLGTMIENKVNLPAPSASFQVIDSYRRYEPVGFLPVIKLSPAEFEFADKIPFPVSSSTRSNPSGRHFYITFATANAGEPHQFRVVPVFVPPKNYVFPKPKRTDLKPKATSQKTTSAATTTTNTGLGGLLPKI